MSTTEDQDQGSAAVENEQSKPKLNLQVVVNKPQSCLRHVVVTIPRADIERYTREAYDNLSPLAAVPGFRPGRAPRKLVERHFRERVGDQVKGSLLMDSLTQVTEEQKFSAISEPDFDFEAIELPESGDFTFEFKVEVRPEFPTPDWKGLKLDRRVESVSDAEIDVAMNRILQRYATTAATDEPAAIGDRLVLNITTSFNGKQLARAEDERITLRQVLSFPDGRCENFGEVMAGAREGDTRTAKIQITNDHSDESLRGQAIDAEFQVVEVIRTELPELTSGFLAELADFKSVDEFRSFIRESLQKQADYRQSDHLRGQIVDTLVQGSDWDLPPDLVRRQTRRELERKRLELRRNNFPDSLIQQVLNSMRQNAQATTERALREHFILEQIAEDEKIDATAEDFDTEIALIAEQSEMPTRRVRARLEKSGQMDALRNQIVERRVIEMITGAATLNDVPYKHEDATEETTTAVEFSATAHADADAIPEARYDDAGKKEEPLPGSESASS